jgi:hypothetical protein
LGSHRVDGEVVSSCEACGRDLVEQALRSRELAGEVRIHVREAEVQGVRQLLGFFCCEGIVCGGEAVCQSLAELLGLALRALKACALEWYLSRAGTYRCVKVRIEVRCGRPCTWRSSVHCAPHIVRGGRTPVLTAAWGWRRWAVVRL